MTDFDNELKMLLSTEDEKFIADHLEETGFYQEVFSSLKGKDGLFFIFTWAGILLFAGGLILCLMKAFQVTNTREQILFATLAIMLNSAQIALKLWFNMRLNRRAVIREIRRLRLSLAKS